MTEAKENLTNRKKVPSIMDYGDNLPAWSCFVKMAP